MTTIALVDDDRNILTSVSIAFETEGYRIMTYTDGASALDGFKSSPPDASAHATLRVCELNWLFYTRYGHHGEVVLGPTAGRTGGARRRIEGRIRAKAEA
jgi:hypothetical protein